MYLHPGNELFEMSKNSHPFVDHTLLIELMNHVMDYSNPFIAMIRPRRFGKTCDLQMLAGKRIKFNPIYRSMDYFHVTSDAQAFTILVYLGYLAYDCIKHEIYIPNYEIRGRLLETIKTYNYGYVSRALQLSDELLEATRNMEAQKVASMIEEIHDMRSSIAYNRELSVVVTLLLAYYSAQDEYYEPIEEYGSGKGYVDLAFLPRGGCYTNAY